MLRQFCMCAVLTRICSPGIHGQSVGQAHMPATTLQHWQQQCVVAHLGSGGLAAEPAAGGHAAIQPGGWHLPEPIAAGTTRVPSDLRSAWAQYRACSRSLAMRCGATWRTEVNRLRPCRAPAPAPTPAPAACPPPCSPMHLCRVCQPTAGEESSCGALVSQWGCHPASRVRGSHLPCLQRVFVVSSRL